MDANNLAQLENRYQRRKLPPWKNIETVTVLFLLVVLPVVCGFLSKLLGDAFFPSTANNGVYIVRAGDYAWFLPGVLLGWGLVGIVTNTIYRFYLSSKYHPSDILSLRFPKRNIEGSSRLKPLLGICVALTLLASFFIYDNYMVIDRQRVVINELTGFSEKKYKIGDVEKISFIRTRKEKQRIPTDSFYAIRFRDGYEFRSRDNFLHFTDEMSRIATFSNRKIDTLLQVR